MITRCTASARAGCRPPFDECCASLSAVQSAVFLDRDNTIIANDGDLGDPSLVRLMSGAAWGVRALREAGYLLIVVTNQGGVARGAYGEAEVDAVHQRTAQLLAEACEWKRSDPLVRDWICCPFHPQGTIDAYRREHPWRKPAPGMLLEGAKRHGIDCARSWMVGDQERDIEAGRAAQCRTIRLLCGGEDATDVRASSSADFVETDLLHASHRILRADGKDGNPRWESTSHTRLLAKNDMLSAPATREIVTAAAHAIAEREGVSLLRVEVESWGVDLEVAGPEVVAIGLASELRRNTNLWAASRGLPSLWAGE